jgi:histidyl-tRNA synthetase
MSNKPGIPRGTRDFGPEKMARRNYIFDTIKSVFKKYGFQPLETPAMENLDVLMGKYGEEGDKLIFKILNSGDFLKKMNLSDIELGPVKVASQICEKALRYDLTVPFARFVAINKNELQFPFRRYQIQPVWRGDAPGFGRYREFYQCDADIVGTNSLVCETELISMVHEVMSGLGIKYTLKINNRKILSAIAERLGMPGCEADFCVSIDKLDKIGEEGVKKELAERGFPELAIEALNPILQFKGSNKEAFAFLESYLKDSEIGKKGLQELQEVFDYVETSGVQASLQFDLTLARGLSYYTGAIMEVKALEVAIGSISGGGRYDNLTELFGVPGLSGVGISFGIDRIYDVLEKLNAFPEDAIQGTQVLICWFDDENKRFGLPLLYQLRQSGINSELYPDKAKIRKQFEYADKKKIHWVVVIGSDEMTSGNLTVKNMLNGEQDRCTLTELIARVKK